MKSMHKISHKLEIYGRAAAADRHKIGKQKYLYTLLLLDIYQLLLNLRQRYISNRRMMVTKRINLILIIK